MVLKKLASLDGGQVNFPERRDSFTNLSAHELTQDQKDLLNLGLNCSILSKRSQHEKKAEIEHCTSRSAITITLAGSRSTQMSRHSPWRRIPRVGAAPAAALFLQDAAKELRANENIVIRREVLCVRYP